jgi:NADPH-dependent ferric siderophore reductase
MNDISVVPHHILMMRRETHRRLVRVVAIEQITPKMRRVRFDSPDF